MSASSAELCWALLGMIPRLVRAIVMLMLMWIMCHWTWVTLSGPAAAISGPWMVSSAVYMIPQMMRQISEDFSTIGANLFDAYFDVFEIRADDNMYMILGILLENVGVASGMRKLGVSGWDEASNNFTFDVWRSAMKCTVWLHRVPIITIKMDFYPCVAVCGRGLLLWHYPADGYAPAKFVIACKSQRAAKDFLRDAVANAAMDVSERAPLLERFAVQQSTLAMPPMPDWIG